MCWILLLSLASRRLHFTKPETSYIDSIGELTRLKEEGKIRSIGISNVNIEQLKEANQHGHIDVVQSPYNMLDRTAMKEIESILEE